MSQRKKENLPSKQRICLPSFYIPDIWKKNKIQGSIHYHICHRCVKYTFSFFIAIICHHRQHKPRLFFLRLFIFRLIAGVTRCMYCYILTFRNASFCHMSVKMRIMGSELATHTPTTNRVCVCVSMFWFSSASSSSSSSFCLRVYEQTHKAPGCQQFCHQTRNICNLRVRVFASINPDVGNFQAVM